MRCYESASLLRPSEQEMQEAASRGRLLTMEIEFSRRCNFNCIYCYLDNNHCYEEELTEAEFHDVIIQAKNLGAETIIVLGGEPMLYPHIMDEFCFMREQGLNIELFTNGVNIDNSTAQKLFDFGINVVLKMNSFDEQIQDTLSDKKGAYKQIQNALKNLRKAGYPGEKQCLGVSTIICRQNFDELIDMWQWLRDQDIIPYFEMITPQGNAKENHALAVRPQRIQELFHQISEIDRQKYGYDWEPQPPLMGRECLRQLYSCLVNSYGDVQPCVGITISVGNVREKKLSDIIKDSEVLCELRNYRENLKGPCRKCDKLEKCYGCRGVAYQMTGDYLASDPSCWENADKIDGIIHLPFDADKLIPHELPMRFVDELLAVKEKASEAEVTVSEDAIFIGEDGMLDEVAYLEIIAQSMAAFKGFKNLKDEKTLEGSLVGVKRLKIYSAAGVGDTLRTCLYKISDFGELGIIKGEVYKGEEMIAEGEITVWHKSEVSAA